MRACLFPQMVCHRKLIRQHLLDVIIIGEKWLELQVLDSIYT